MNIEIIQKEAEQTVAIKRQSVPFDRSMGSVMAEAYQTLWAYLKQQGKQVVGVPYCKYTNGNKDFTVFDIELGVPVGEKLPPQGDVVPSTTCAGKAVCTVHQGPYDEIESTYSGMMEYLYANNLEPTGVYYDYYLNDPSQTPPAELQTKVVIMVH